MNKVFYRPGTLEVIGMSDGEDSIQFMDGSPYPYIQTEEPHESLSNLVVELNEKEEPELFYIKGSLDDPDPIKEDVGVKPEEVAPKDSEEAVAATEEETIK